MATFLDLPVELIVIILAYLDVRDLSSIAETCHSLNHVINDQELWRNIFKTRFAADTFSSVSRSSKFSVELFARSTVMREWKRGRATQRVVPLRTFNITDVLLQYPTVMAYHRQGSMYVMNFEKWKSDMDIPITTDQGSTATNFDTKHFVYGNAAGELFSKQLARKDIYSRPMSMNAKHMAMVSSVHIWKDICYSADMNGCVMVSDIRTGELMKEHKVSAKPISHIKGAKDVVIAVDYESIRVFNHDRKETWMSIEHTDGCQFFDVDFAGKVVVIASEQKVFSYSFSPDSFGSRSVYSVGTDERISLLAMEQKEGITRDVAIGGQDGLNLAIVVSERRVITFDIRRSLLKAQSGFTPVIPGFYVEPPVSSIDVNSTVVLVGSHNGWASIHDVLNGDLIRVISSKIPAKNLLWNNRRAYFPVGFVKLAKQNQTCGILVVNNVVHYFQFGDDPTLQISKKVKKSVNGVASERKSVIKKNIKHAMLDMDLDDYEQYKRDELLEKYNGDLSNGEDLEIAIALNESIQHRDNDEDDVELAAALERSRLEHESRIAEPSNVHGAQLLEGGDSESQDVDFERQLQEALKRSLKD